MELATQGAIWLGAGVTLVVCYSRRRRRGAADVARRIEWVADRAAKRRTRHKCGALHMLICRSNSHQQAEPGWRLAVRPRKIVDGADGLRDHGAACGGREGPAPARADLAAQHAAARRRLGAAGRASIRATGRPAWPRCCRPRRSGRGVTARAIEWLMATTGQESSFEYGLRQWLLGNRAPGRTGIRGLAVDSGRGGVGRADRRRHSGARKENRRRPLIGIRQRIEAGRKFLLLRACRGRRLEPRLGAAARIRIEAPTRKRPEWRWRRCAASSAPEVERSVAVARRFLLECRSADAQNWLRLGLAAHGRTARRATAARAACRTARFPKHRSTFWPATPPPAEISSGADHGTRNSQGANGWPPRRRAPGADRLQPAGSDDAVHGVHRAGAAVRPEPLRHVRETLRARAGRARASTSCSNRTWWSSSPKAPSTPTRCWSTPPSRRSARWAPPACASPRGRDTAAIRMDMADAAGYFQTVPEFEDIFTDLNLDDVTRVRPERQFSRLGKLYLPQHRARRRPAGRVCRR